MFKFLGLGIFTGVILGFIIPLNISLINEKILLVLILVGFTVLLSSANAKLLKQFDYMLFTNEFILNSILSVGLVFLGNLMGLDLFTIVALVLVYRLFYDLQKLIKTLVTKNKKDSIV